MDADSKDSIKRKGVTLQKTKDGRMYFHMSFAATISKPKLAVAGLTFLVVLLYVIAPWIGVKGSVAMRRRISELEDKLQKKISWVVQHRDHLQTHLGKNGYEAKVHEDGRKHLLIPPGGVSRLAEAMAPNTQLAEFDDHYLCGDRDVPESEVIRKTIAIAAITWAAPKSLANAMETWQTNGLLDIADEKMLFINSSPTAEEDHAIAQKYDFDVYTTQEHNGNIMAGPSLAYLVGNSTSDYILLMEKDFVLSAKRDVVMREMYTAVQHLARGVDCYRLRGKTDHPAEGMPDCCSPAEPPNCPYNSGWRSAGDFSAHMNWLFVYCDPNVLENSNGRLAMCTSEPDAPTSYCYTSAETNWSNNPVLFPRKWFMEKMLDVAFMDWERNNMFEFNAMLAWLAWKPPARVCSSLQGIFTHFEIDQ